MTVTGWKNKEVPTLDPNDEIFKDTKPTDLVIAVIGSSGVGKSTLINTLSSGSNRTKVNRNLKCGTHGIAAFPCTHPPDSSKRHVIVDTPGFDDPYVTISHILDRLSAWLEASYNGRMKLAGVIYIHEASQPQPGRNGKVTDEHLEKIRKLCSEHRSVLPLVLGMSNWNGNAATEEYCLSKIKGGWWELLTNDNTRKVVRFKNNVKSSAWAMVNAIPTN
ncbi:hypothetical protein BDQ17DRAFT_1422424 [Cyathus striatus]|nr:hypothetical protein BDQ17DRAFT_1422424 [Cyathus striatus]